MIYSILKISARLALRIYCADLIVQDKKAFRQKGPLLFASNHPNSFLDAAILASRTSRKTHILVRGDVFTNKWANLFLRYLGCLPIYRGQDGRSMLGQNTLTFQECQTIFESGENVLIFSEGNCENEWRLRPLGKGTARLAMMSLQSSSSVRSLQVIPTGFTYSHFNGIGKRVIVLTGEALHPKIAPGEEQKNLRTFNEELEKQLSQLILQFEPNKQHVAAAHRLIASAPFNTKNSFPKVFENLQQQLASLENGNIPQSKIRPWVLLKKIMLSPFAAAGWLLHAPFYYPINTLAKSRTQGTVYYDSVLFGLLFLLYPLYLIVLAAFLMIGTHNKCYGLIIIIAPLLAFLTVKSGLVGGSKVK